MEICIDCIESAQNAANGGAIRLEVCSALSDGGLTPTPGLVKTLREIIKVPLFAMIRIRAGNFVYSSNEVEAMLYDVKLLKDLGTDGFVFGALTAEATVDVEVNNKVIEAAYPLPVTFHRAFDEVANPQEALECIIRLGFKRLLTSGQKNSAHEGLDLIERLVTLAPNDFTIIPGAGITVENLKEIRIRSKCREFHASARTKKLQQGTKCKMGSEKESISVMVTDEDTVHKLCSILNDVTSL